jgi:hypothetical protein
MTDKDLAISICPKIRISPGVSILKGHYGFFRGEWPFLFSVIAENEEEAWTTAAAILSDRLIDRLAQ